MMICEPPEILVDTKDSCRTGPSCQALRSAIAALYRLDDFYLERIGSGFFSDVYKVEHKTTGQIMALKMNTDPTNRPNVLREIQLMNKLDHPNILKFRGVCVHAGCLHALTEYMNGGSLDEWIQDSTKSFVWSLRIKLALDTAKGMSYLHSKDIFHRDLNPKNILIQVSDQKPVAIIADFGLADAIPDELKRDSVRLPVRGTSWYLGPEILTDKWYDQRADVFAFGITLCQLIARISSDPDVLPRTQNYGVDYVAFSIMSGDCPPNFLQFTFKCCLVEPKSRPTFMEAVKILENVWKKLRARNQLLVGSTRPQPFLDDARVNQKPTGRRRSTSVLHSRPTRRSTSLAYVDLLDINAAQNRCVGEHMRRIDPHYIPAAANPFPLLPEEYRDGRKKIVGYTSSLCPTVFDVPILFRPVAGTENLSVPIPAFKNSHSCPTSPNASRRDFSRFASPGGPEQPTTCYESSSWHHCVTQVSPNSTGSDVEDESTAKIIMKNVKARLGLVRPVSPDSELAYYSLSDQSSCESFTPKSSSRCSNESDGQLASVQGGQLAAIPLAAGPCGQLAAIPLAAGPCGQLAAIPLAAGPCGQLAAIPLAAGPCGQLAAVPSGSLPVESCGPLALMPGGPLASPSLAVESCGPLAVVPGASRRSKSKLTPLIRIHSVPESEARTKDGVQAATSRLCSQRLYPTSLVSLT